MTDFYSNHYGPAVGATNHFTTLQAPVPFVPVGLKHSRLRRTAAQLIVPSGQNLADDDVIRFLDLRSNDRLINLFISMDANWGATSTFNVGLHLKGANDDGAVVDEDLFVAPDNWAAGDTRTDLFTLAVLDDWDRGKTMWALATIGAASLTEDPGVVYTVSATASANPDATDDAVEMLLEAYYIAGD